MKTKLLPRHRDRLLVLDAGDEVMASLIEFAKKNQVQAASFFAIGALENATVAYWNRESKEYEHIDVTEQVEMLSFSGSVARSGNDVKIHAHAVLGRRYGSTIGGHVMRATVYPTLEIFIVDYSTSLARRKDEETGLWLLDLR